MTHRMPLCSIWEGFDGERFEVVDVGETVVLRSTRDGRRLEVPTWKFEAGLLREVEPGRRRLFAPSDIKVGREIWSLDYATAIRPEAKSQRKNRYLCRVYVDADGGSVSYKHMSVRQICARLNTNVDHVVDGDLRPGVEFKNGIKIAKVEGRTVWLEAKDGRAYDVAPLSVLLTALNRGDRLLSWVELRCTLAFAPDGTPYYIANRSPEGTLVAFALGSESVVTQNVYLFCSNLNVKNRDIRCSDLRPDVCIPMAHKPNNGFVRVVEVLPNEVKFVPYLKIGSEVCGIVSAETKEFLDFVNGKRDVILMKQVRR